MILAIAGGKGGVGKTTVAYNLGAALDDGGDATADGRSERSAPSSNRRSVVVDADLGMADLPRERGPDLHDVLAGRADPIEAVREGPTRLLPCGRSLAGARAADVAALGDVLRDLERSFGRVVVDCPAGMRADAGVPLAVADACLAVASPRPFALADAVRTRELARELDAGLVGVALNRVIDDPPVEAVRDALGAPATPLPADPRLARSVEREAPVVRAAPESAPAEAVASLARAVRVCERT